MRVVRLRPILALFALLSAVMVAGASAQTPPTGFQDTLFTDGLSSPTALAFAPDGRLFVLEKASGRVMIVENGTLLPTPFADMNAFIPNGMFLDSYFERGLLGIAFDPAFATNGFVYLYYTICKVPHPGGTPGTSTGCDSPVNRVARVTATGDVVDPNSHTVIFDDIRADGGNHNGGWIDFGPLDGKLYVSVGEHGNPSLAQDLAWNNGKILRLNKDGSIPSDNPFVATSGARPEIWALGLRNPFRCRFHPDGRLFCGDVGQNTWEEIDVVSKGGNYGWSTTEGTFDASTYPTFTNPIYAYQHQGGQGNAIIAGIFGSETNFPGDYQTSFFFGDYVTGAISRVVLDGTGLAVQSVEAFVPDAGANSLTDMAAGPDGSLYYTNYGAGSVRKVAAVTNRSPVAVAGATPDTGTPPLVVQFSSTGTNDPDGDTITYSWDFGDGSAVSTLANPMHTYTTAGPKHVVLTVSDGKPLPGPGTTSLTVSVGTIPVVTIAEPLDGALFTAGDVIDVAGTAVDTEDGPIAGANLHWKVVLHHNTHTHPYIDDLVGAPNTFTIATDGETDPNIWYEIDLSATDTSGLTGTDTVSVYPIHADLTFQTTPPGLGILLDGQPQATPLTLTSVVGIERKVSAPAPQTGPSGAVNFQSWSDGGAQSHTLSTPVANTTYTATFASACDVATIVPPAGGSLTGTTSGGSTQSGSCSSTNTAPEDVFQWTPAVSGVATIDTCGVATLFDTVMYVRSTSCDTGTEIACNDDTTGCATGEPNANHGSRVTPTVTAGHTYFITVDGYNGTKGAFGLRIVPPSGATTTTTSTLAATTSSTSTTSSAPTTSSNTSTTATSTTSTSVTSTSSSTTTSGPTTSSSSITTSTGVTSSSTLPPTTSSTTATSTSSTTATSTSATSTSSVTSSSATSTSSSSSTAPTTSSTTSTTAPPCGTTCDDSDACTLDTCEASGCIHTPHPADDLASVQCSVTNLQTSLNATSLCTADCPRSVARRLTRTNELIDAAPKARTLGKCRHRLRASARVAKALASRLDGLMKRGRITPPAAAERVDAAMTALRARIASLPGSYCPQR